MAKLLKLLQMGIHALHQDPENNKKSALNDEEAKKLLEAFDIALVPELYVSQPTEVVAAAREIGFPVVVKGVGANLLHKTDRGLVHLNLLDDKAVENAAQKIAAEAREELDGFLIQPHLEGRREFVAGLFQDDQFGPVIMFGVGGVFTEAFADVSFRLAPLTQSDAAEMLEEIRGKALLGDFRGEKAVDRDALIQTLLGLSRIGTERSGNFRNRFKPPAGYAPGTGAGGGCAGAGRRPTCQSRTAAADFTRCHRLAVLSQKRRHRGRIRSIGQMGPLIDDQYHQRRL